MNCKCTPWGGDLLQLPLVATSSHGAFGADGVVPGGVGGRGLDSDLRQALSGLPRSPPSAAAAAAAEDEAARVARLAVFQAVPPFPVFVRSPLSGSAPLPSRSPMMMV